MRVDRVCCSVCVTSRATVVQSTEFGNQYVYSTCFNSLLMTMLMYKISLMKCYLESMMSLFIDFGRRQVLMIHDEQTVLALGTSYMLCFKQNRHPLNA